MHPLPSSSESPHRGAQPGNQNAAKDPAERRDAQLVARVPAAILERYRAAAAARGESVADYLIRRAPRPPS